MEQNSWTGIEKMLKWQEPAFKHVMWFRMSKLITLYRTTTGNFLSKSMVTSYSLRKETNSLTCDLWHVRNQTTTKLQPYTTLALTFHIKW